MATEWTDEKHRLYLDSLEASFVKQLYNNEYGSNTFGWLSRSQKQKNSSASESSDVKSQPFDQLKVLRRGCWENIKSERVNGQFKNDKKSTNPWVQHFRSPSTAKAPHLTSPAQKVENNLVSHSVDLINRRPGREETSLEKPSPFCSHKVHKVSIGSITEVSGQNFLDMDVESGEELNRNCSAKRARSAASPITDQVLFVLPTSEKTVFMKEDNEQDSEGDVESTAESRRTVSQVSPPFSNEMI